MADQGPDRRKRKRPYRQRVICAECKREVDSDYKDNHAKTVHKGKKVAFVMERNQGQLVFSNKSSTESRPCRKLFRAVVQLDARDEESTVTTHNQELLPGISSIVSEDIQNDKLQWDPSRDGHAIENELEPIPSRSEPPLSSCSNVQTDGIEAVEMSLVSVVLEEGDHPDVYVPLQESIEEPEPSPLQTVEVAMVLEVSEMIVLSQRDDSAVC